MSDEEEGISCNAKKISALRCSFPFAGSSGNERNKLTACCPACGANSRIYCYPPKGEGRSKHCYRCGFDKAMQSVFVTCRKQAKEGIEPDAKWLMNALSYHDLVWGKK